MSATSTPSLPLPEMNRPLVIVGHSPVMRRIEREIDVAAESDVTVLIAGESGVGRRLIARTIHDRSARHAGPLVSVNCVCLPDARLESELFGDVTDNIDWQSHVGRGRLEAADGGTVMLHDLRVLELEAAGAAAALHGGPGIAASRIGSADVVGCAADGHHAPASRARSRQPGVS